MPNEISQAYKRDVNMIRFLYIEQTMYEARKKLMEGGSKKNMKVMKYWCQDYSPYVPRYW